MQDRILGIRSLASLGMVNECKETLRQPFANLSPNLCQPFLPTPLQAPLSVDRRHAFRGTGSRLFGCCRESLVALYRAMRLRFGYGFESCDANDPRNVKNTYLAKHRPIFLHPLLLVGSKELVLRVPKRGQFHAAIRVTRKRCDSCAQLALGTRTVSRRNF